MVGVVVFVEGGGDSRGQSAPLREAMHAWIEKALPPGRRVRVIACGGRDRAYQDFRRGVEDTFADKFCVLLVDSEEAVTAPSRWAHVEHRDRWTAPAGTDDANLHFMARTMEAWLCSDPDALAAWFGDGFKQKKLPARQDLEEEPKDDLSAKLKSATESSKRGAYHKGNDLALIGTIAPGNVMKRCRHAVTFVDELKRRTAPET